MRRGTVLALGALMLACQVRASGMDDGNAGLQALKQGAYDEAVRDFSRALASGQLGSDEQEFAYYGRGMAYGYKGQYGNAIADLKVAVRMKPNDTEAQSALQSAIAQKVNMSDLTPAPNPSSAFFRALGQSILSGAAAGIAQGLQPDAPQ
jgi:tetratricopeptide (TPR) repeat protein